MTSNKKANRKSVAELAKKAGFPELWVPRQIQHVDEIPLLGSGKTDYVRAEAMAMQMKAG